MRKPLCIAAIAMSVLVTCNYDEGQCWIDGQEDGAVGAGGGPIVPGAGGFGDVPPEPQDATDPTPDCLEGEGDATELGAVSCGPSAWGADCMMLCAQNGVSCPAGVKHTVTKKLILLYECCGCKGKQQCWYADPDDTGKVCVYRPELGIAALMCI